MITSGCFCKQHQPIQPHEQNLEIFIELLQERTNWMGDNTEQTKEKAEGAEEWEMRSKKKEERTNKEGGTERGWQK
jgi:hypothetical protein